jgi:hypothetical protein
MSRNKIYRSFGVLLCFLFMVSMAHGQLKQDSIAANNRGIYSLILYAGGGISFYTGDAGTPVGLPSTIYTVHPIGSFRVMWQPDHLLSVGLESGWTEFYSYNTDHGGTSSKTSVTAVPILMVFSMPIGDRIHVFAAPGTYLLTSKLNYGGETVLSTNSLGWMLAANYVQPINKRIGIAGELKWMDAYETRDANLSIQVQLVWRFLSW